LGFFHGKRTQLHRVYHSEYGCVRANAEREREQGHGGEAGVLRQLTEGEFEIIERKG
jgi:hypothetical protein